MISLCICFHTCFFKGTKKKNHVQGVQYCSNCLLVLQPPPDSVSNFIEHDSFFFFFFFIRLVSQNKSSRRKRLECHVSGQCVRMCDSSDVTRFLIPPYMPLENGGSNWLPIIEPYCCWAEDSYGSWADDGGKHKPDPGDRQAQSAVHTLKLVPSVLPYQWTPSTLPARCSRCLALLRLIVVHADIINPLQVSGLGWYHPPPMSDLNTYGAYRHSQRDPSSQPWDMYSDSIAGAHLPPAPF